MADYHYNELDLAPIVKDNIYRYGPRGGSADDLFGKLMKVGSAGGIRPKTRARGSGYAYIVLVSRKSSWEDNYDSESGIFTYHGDNNSSKKDPNSKGNRCLISIFDNAESDNVPLFIFKSTIGEENGSTNAYRFVGVAAPSYNEQGQPNYSRDTFGTGEDAFENYIYSLQVIDTGDEDLREWMKSCLNGRPEQGAPQAWVDFKNSHQLSRPSKEKPGNPFMDYLRSKGFHYDKEFIEDFLLGLKSKHFMIFCGSTGTGKTKLAQLYCEFMGTEHIIVPVGSNWTDSKYMVGYRNAITKEIVKTDALIFIESSITSPEKPFFLILDEMNLSHVERYFSDFLSVMESNAPLKTPGGDILELKENLFIIGTMNVDETTYSISPKVLDRANVMVFGAANINNYLGETSEPADFKGDVIYLNDCMKNECKGRKAMDLLSEIHIDSIKTFIVELQETMTSIGMPFGYRTVDEIMRFMYSSWVYERKSKEFNWQRYMESQVLMKVLPKIHGDISMETGLDRLKSLLSLNNMNKASEKVQRMIDLLTIRRYTSFIS